MTSIQLIDSGRNTAGERVILWSLGNYRYDLEIAGRANKFEADYYEALDHFRLEVGEMSETA